MPIRGKTAESLTRINSLFYQKLHAGLEEMEFEVNPYDPYVANRDVLRSQCTYRDLACG